LKADDPKRKAAFEDAIKQFDAFIQKFPQSDYVESAYYGRALASFQIENYDDVAKTLRDSLQRFPQSESIPDSEYLLALTYATQANTMLRAPNVAADVRKQAGTKFDDAIKLLRDIIAKRTNLVLANDSQFQIGEILFNRAAFAEESQRPALF